MFNTRLKTKQYHRYGIALKTSSCHYRSSVNQFKQPIIIVRHLSVIVTVPLVSVKEGTAKYASYYN